MLNSDTPCHWVSMTGSEILRVGLGYCPPMRSPFKARATSGEVPALPSAEAPVEAHLAYPMYGNGLHLPIRPDSYAQILESARSTHLPAADEQFLVDWSGIRTRIPMLSWAPQELAGQVVTSLPIPTDGYRSEAEEYIGVIVSTHSSRADYLVIEAGAGWAPWTVAGVVVARRAGKHARGIAIEADPVRAGWAVCHAQDNGLSSLLITGSPQDIARSVQEHRHDVDVLVVQAAVWHAATTLRFPTLGDDDMGGAVQADDTGTMDYRGAHFDHVDVPTITLSTLMADDATVDFLHVDLQGQELAVIIPALELIESQVRFMAVGTHNRYVEGLLQEELLPREWALLAESPCTAVFDGVKPSLTGFTIQDGNQLWANSRFRDADPVVVRTR